jgi:hypothetical protein
MKGGSMSQTLSVEQRGEEWAADDMATFASQLGAVLLPWAS